MNKYYLEGLQAGLDLATKIALDNGIELKFPNVSELKIVKDLDHGKNTLGEKDEN